MKLHRKNSSLLPVYAFIAAMALPVASFAQEASPENSSNASASPSAEPAPAAADASPASTPDPAVNPGVSSDLSAAPSVDQPTPASPDLGKDLGPSASSEGDQANVQAVHSKAEIDAAAELGKLNAQQDSGGIASVNPDDNVAAISTYQQAMQAALAKSDAQERDAAITAARQALASSSNRTLTASAIGRIDKMLDLTGADATLGTSS